MKEEIEAVSWLYLAKRGSFGNTVGHGFIMIFYPQNS